MRACLLSLCLSLSVAKLVTLSNVELPIDNQGNRILTGEATVLYVPAAALYYVYFNNWGGCPGVDCCPSPAGCASCCFATGYAPDPCV